MKTGRMRVLIVGIILGIAIPWNPWTFLEEIAKNPDLTSPILKAFGIGVVLFAIYVAAKEIKREMAEKKRQN